MKTTVSTMDLRIATAMREAANVVFNAMEIKQDVNITSVQVYEHFTNGRKTVAGMPKDMEFIKNIPVCSGEGWEIGADAEITINIDSYSCKLYGIAIFRYLHTFERIASVKDRARFIYSVPASSSAVTLNITVAKNAKDILCHAANDNLRQIMCGVYVDFLRGNIVATDGHTVQVMRCEISGGVPSVEGVVIPSDIAKRALSKCAFSLTIDGDNIVCDGAMFQNLGEYVRYLSVWRSFSSEDSEYIKMAPNAWKEIARKARITPYDKVTFVFHALSGNHFVSVDVWNRAECTKVNEFRFEVQNAVPNTFALGINADYIIRFKDVEGFQGLESGRHITIFGKNYIGLAMPSYIADLPINYGFYVNENNSKEFSPVADWKVKRYTIAEPEPTAVEVASMAASEPTAVETPTAVEVASMAEPEPTAVETPTAVEVASMAEPEPTAVEIPTAVEVASMAASEPTAVEIPTAVEVASMAAAEPTAVEIPTAVEVASMAASEPTAVEGASMAASEPTAVEGVKMWLISTFAAVAACLIVFICLSIKPRTTATAAPTVAPVATVSEAAEIETINAADVVTIEAAINDVICTGSFDTYYNKVKEEITRNYRDIMKSQLYELADLASVDDSEVIAALADPETDPETPESVPTVETIEDTENTPESVEIMPETDTETDAGTVSDNTEIDYNSSEFVELSVITTDANGNQVVNVYSVPLNE